MEGRLRKKRMKLECNDPGVADMGGLVYQGVERERQKRRSSLSLGWSERLRQRQILETMVDTSVSDV